MGSQSRFRAGVSLVLGLAVASCNGRNPVAPSQPPATSSSPVVRLEINAPSRIEPGQSVQVTARAVRADGGSQDVTNRAQWSSTNSAVLQSGTAGHVTGLRVGEASVSATYDDSGRWLYGSVPVTVLVRDTYKISGRITENGAGILNARVTVLSGVGAGEATVSGHDGRFGLYGVSGQIAVEVKREGYLLRVEELHVSATATHDIEIVPDRQRSDLSGNYVLTLEAGACNVGGAPLREDLRRRTYKAAVEQQGPRLFVSLTGSTFAIGNGRGNRFAGVVDPLDTVRFDIQLNTDGYVYIDGGDLIEHVDSTTDFLVYGTVNARAQKDIVGTLTGAFIAAPPALPYSWSSVTSCHSTHHVFTMRRQ